MESMPVWSTVDMGKRTPAQELLRTHLQELGVTTEFEYRFHPERAWRFDLANYEHRLGFECDGNQFSRGHHVGYISKAERKKAALEGRRPQTQTEIGYDKQNAAQMMGWRILRFTNEQILKGEALAWLKANL